MNFQDSKDKSREKCPLGRPMLSNCSNCEKRAAPVAFVQNFGNGNGPVHQNSLRFLLCIGTLCSLHSYLTLSKMCPLQNFITALDPSISISPVYLILSISISYVSRCDKTSRIPVDYQGRLDPLQSPVEPRPMSWLRVSIYRVSIKSFSAVGIPISQRWN